MTTKTKNKLINAGLIILAILFAVAVGVIIGFSVQQSNNSNALGNVIYGEDDTISFLDEPQPPIVDSGLPSVISEPVRIGGQSEISPLSIDISPMSLELSDFIIAQDPSSFPTQMMNMHLNGKRINNLTTTGQIELNSSEGFVIEIEQSYSVDWYEGEGKHTYDYMLYFSKDGGSWYSTKPQQIFEVPVDDPTPTNRIAYNLAELGSGIYEVCAVYKYAGGGGINGFQKDNHGIYTIVYDSEAISVPLPAPPVKEGYTFAGWFFDAEFTREFKDFVVKEDTTLYAKYVINTYVVTFNTNGGSPINPATVNWGTTVHFEVYISSKIGCTPLGWFSDANCVTAIDSIVVKNDVTVFAGWEVKTVTVTLIIEGQEPQIIPVPHGTKIIQVIEQAQGTQYYVKSITTNGMEYDSVTETAVLKDNAIIQMSAKPLDDQWAALEWWWKALIIGGPILLIGIVVIVAIVVKNNKKKAVAVANIPASKPTNNTKTGKPASKPSAKPQSKPKK